MIKRIIFIILISTNFCQLNAQNENSKGDSVGISYYLPKVIVTANRYEKNLFETHIPVNMITEREIWQRGTDNVGEMLQQKAGVTYTSAGPWSQKLVIRGMAVPQVLTLVDGMRLDVLRSYGNHAPLIDVDQVERVEIIRGPASILYGSDAIAGVVNFITKKPVTVNKTHIVNGSAFFQYSSVNKQYDENVKLAANFRKWNFLLGLNNRDADNIRTPSGILKNTEFSGYTVDTRIGYMPSRFHYFSLSGQLNRSKNVGIPIDEYAADAKFLKYDRDAITFSYEYRAPQMIWSNLRMNLFYQQEQRNFDAFIYQKPKGSLFVNQTLNAHRNADAHGGNIQTSVWLFKNNLLTSGIDVFTEFDDTRRIADPAIYNAAGTVVKDPPPDYAPPTPKSNRKGLGVFLEDEYDPWSKWTFTMGVRFDYINSHADATEGTLVEKNQQQTDRDVSGSVGALFRLTEQIHLLVNAGRAFKAPTLQERFFKGTAQVGYLYGNPDLKSETSFNMDAGMKWKFNKISGECNVFRNQIENFIVMKPISVTADTFLYDNVGKAELYGSEFELSYSLSKRIALLLNVSYVHGQDVNLAEPLPKMPPLESLVGIKYNDPQDLYWIEATTRLVDSQNRVAENEMKTQGYQIVNLSSGLNLSHIFKWRHPLYMTCNVKNLFNESYRDHLSSVTWWDAPGRNIVIGIRSQF